MKLVAKAGEVPGQPASRSLRFPARPGRWLQSIGPVAVLVVLALAFQLASHNFLSPGNLAAIAEAVAVPVILATGLSFVILLGAIDLSLEGVMATSSMTVALLAANNVNGHHWGIWAIVAALGVGVVFGAFNGVLNTYFRMPSLIVTLGSWFIGLGIASVLFPSQVPGIRDPIVLGLASTQFAGLSLIVFIAVAVAGDFPPCPELHSSRPHDLCGRRRGGDAGRHRPARAAIQARRLHDFRLSRGLGGPAAVGATR